MMFRIVCILLLVSTTSAAQNFGGFPPSTRWQQINTDTARIIFTEGARWQANRIASIIHRMAADTPFAIGKDLKKIPIVLHSRTTLANGYVALGPFRSEYYLIPGSNIFDFGSLPWYVNLAVHEYRHVQQYNNFNHGLSKAFRVVLGQQGQALANALSVPDWFFEGDAVFAETAFTGLGRGRQPLFLSAYNSLWQEGETYKWQKLRNGSFRDFVPNHYYLGYLMVNYGYRTYGPSFWSKVTRDASAFRGLFYPFQRAVRRYSGIDYKTFRKNALAYYSSQVAKKDIPVYEGRTVTNFYFPQRAGGDTLLYVKESYRKLPAFYREDVTGTHRIRRRSISSEDWFSFRKGTIAYTAFSVHPRWNLVDYSNIILLDVASGKERQLTRKGKYYTPDLSPDGTKVIAVSVNDSLETDLHLLDVATGKLLQQWKFTDHAFLVHPRFRNEHQVVVGIRHQEGTMEWNQLDLLSGKAEPLMPPAFAAVGYPFIQDSILYFTGSYAGNDDLYAWEFENKKLFRLTEGQTGNYYPSVSGDTLLWSAYTRHGLQLQQRRIDRETWVPVTVPDHAPMPARFAVAGDSVNLMRTRLRNFAQHKFSQATGLLQFHSWDPSSASIYSNNILNTLAAEIFYRYNEAEKAHTTGFNLAYGGCFPVINAGYEYTFNRHIETTSRTITANSWEGRLGYEVPLNLTKGRTLKSLQWGSDLVYNRFQPTGASKNLYNRNDAVYLQHFLSWAQQLPRARQQIYPRLGYNASGSYRHLLNKKGFQDNARAAVFLPSFFNNHSVVLQGSFQRVDTGNTTFSNRFSLARGYTDYYFTRMWTAGFNYHMPLLYPDFGFASIVYLMRVRSNLYFDYSKVYSKTGTIRDPLRSTGVEILLDTRWWNQLPVSFGVRYSYLIDRKYAGGNRNVFEFIMPVGLIPD